MKKILLMLFLSAPAVAVAFHFIIGAGATGNGVGEWISPIIESTEQQGIPTGENGATANLQGVRPLPDPPSGYSSGLFSPPKDPPTVFSWEVEPGGPLGYSYPVSPATIWGYQESPPVIAGLSLARMGGSLSPLGGGGSSPTGSGGSSPNGGGGSTPTGSGGSSPTGGGGSPPTGSGGSSPIGGGGLPPVILPDNTQPPIDLNPHPEDGGSPYIPPTNNNSNPPIRVPEPGTLFLLGTGLAGLLWIGRRVKES